jgi:hypothetical protein
MAKSRRNARSAGALARQILDMPTDQCDPQSRGERGENGLIKCKDESKERLVVPGGAPLTLGKALPDRAEVQKKITGMNAKQAVAVLMQSDIENGDFVKVWEKKKAMAKGGDFRAIEAYLDRFIGKATQPLAIAADVRVSLSSEDREALSAIRLAFGMTAKPDVVATVEGKEVQ